MTLQNSTGLSPSGANWLDNHAHQVTHLPPPPETYTHVDVDLSYQTLTYLKEGGIIHRIEKAYDTGTRSRVNVYRTSWPGYNRIQELKRGREQTERMLPCTDGACAANGFVTIDDDRVRCKRCDEVHGKSEVRL